MPHVHSRCAKICVDMIAMDIVIREHSLNRRSLFE